MKNIETIGITEMNITEMTTINGGDWFDYIVDSVNGAIDTVNEAWEETVTHVNDFIDALAEPLPNLNDYGN